jgi:DNA polymerase III subunit gamma/tau
MQMNLARKWRSKRFDELVGQSLVVRLVKNSLYRDLIFPVYLLSGTRGSGKTSLARIFAAALNCQELATFQKNPQDKQLPCLSCTSCVAMQNMSHPDFIEMDAASHTGVDNVRQIIEAASFIPVLGTKKIYLIDEAHMLSKAAFNALLKMLEEPPAFVVFMLATTDPHKILETVTSRCFQLFFEPISSEDVVRHLEFICGKEELSYESDALALVAQETEGSMRDALNLIERLRIAYPHITKQAVNELLGSIDEDRVIELFQILLQGSVEDLFAAYTKLELKKYNPQIVWKKLVEVIRLSLWLKNGVEPKERGNLKLKPLVGMISYEKLIALFELCYTYELSFLKTAEPGSMLEMMLLKLQLLAQQKESSKPSESSPSPKQRPPNIAQSPILTPKQVLPMSTRAASGDEQDQDVRAIIPEKKSLESVDLSADSSAVALAKAEASAEEGTTWQRCLAEIEKLHDPLVISIFKQGVEEKYDAEAGTLEIFFPQDLAFFKEWLENTKKKWSPILAAFFGEGTELQPHFVRASTKERSLKMGPVPQGSVAPVSRESMSDQRPGGTTVERNSSAVSGQATGIQRSQYPPSKPAALNRSGDQQLQKRQDTGKPLVPDAEKWQKSHLLAQIFPGTLTEQERENT